MNTIEKQANKITGGLNLHINEKKNYREKIELTLYSKNVIHAKKN